MGDFVKLGLKVTNYAVDKHFDKIPEKHFGKIPDPVFAPREALRNVRHRGRNKKNGNESSASGDDNMPRSARSVDRQQRRKSSRRRGAADSGSDEDGYGYRSDGGQRGRRNRRRRRSMRDDSYYREGEQRPRASSIPYIPDAARRRRRSLYTPTLAQAAVVGAGAGAAAGYSQNQQQQNPYIPSTNAVPRGAPPAARYDPRYPDSTPNAGPYYPSQYRAPSPRLPTSPPSTSYASAAYVPYPYPTATAAAAAFGAERPYEYEPNGAQSAGPPQPMQDYSRSPSRSRSRSRSRTRHRRRRHRKDRPAGAIRRASSTGATPSSNYQDDADFTDSNSYRPSSRSITTTNTTNNGNSGNRPNIHRRASSTSAIDRGTGAGPAPSRKRDFGLPSKLSSSDRALGASSAGALAGGFLAQEIHALLQHPPPPPTSTPASTRRRASQHSDTKSTQKHALALTLLGAVVGGLGANLLAGKEERKRSAGERGSAREWVRDLKGEKREAVRGWKGEDSAGGGKGKGKGKGKGRARRRPVKFRDGRDDDDDNDGDGEGWGEGHGGGGGGGGEEGGSWFGNLLPDGLDGF